MQREVLAELVHNSKDILPVLTGSGLQRPDLRLVDNAIEVPHLCL